MNCRRAVRPSNGQPIEYVDPERQVFIRHNICPLVLCTGVFGLMLRGSAEETETTQTGGHQRIGWQRN